MLDSEESNVVLKKFGEFQAAAYAVSSSEQPYESKKVPYRSDDECILSYKEPSQPLVASGIEKKQPSSSIVMFHRCVPESPFYWREQMLNQQIKKLIGKVGELGYVFSDELATRLNWLHEAAKEGADVDLPTLSRSVEKFYQFLKHTPHLKYPNVALTPSDEIRPQWQEGPNKHFAATFLPSGTVRYVIFTPNPKDPDQVDRLSGITSVEALMDTAEPHGVLEWVALHER